MPDAMQAELDATWDRVGAVALRMAQQGGAPGDQFLEDLLVLREAFDALQAGRAQAAPVLVALKQWVDADVEDAMHAALELQLAAKSWRAAREG